MEKVLRDMSYIILDLVENLDKEVREVENIKEIYRLVLLVSNNKDKELREIISKDNLVNGDK